MFQQPLHLTPVVRHDRNHSNDQHHHRIQAQHLERIGFLLLAHPDTVPTSDLPWLQQNALRNLLNHPPHGLETLVIRAAPREAPRRPRIA